MNNSPLFCKNLCGNRIYLTAPLLPVLTANGWDILFGKSVYQRYADFFSLFPAIRAGREAVNKEEPQLWFVERLPRESWPRQTLVIPVGVPTPQPSSRENLARAISRDIPDADDVLDRLHRITAAGSPLHGKKVLITAGPTVEDIDPVRFFSNRSTGKMGLALARAAFRLGASVTLVLGPTSLSAPAYAEVINVRSASDMFRQVKQHFEACDYFVAAAAVADFTPVTRYSHKIKKKPGNMLLELQRTEDILKHVARHKKKSQKVIGFSVETEKLLENSRKKLLEKNIDMIVANNPREQGAGFATDTNKVTLIYDGGSVDLGLRSKLETAQRIFKKVRQL